MNFPCLITLAENSYEARQERKERALEKAKEALGAEYMAAACMPLIATVNVPSYGFPNRRDSFLDVFIDNIGERKHRELVSRAVSILMRSTEGREVIQTLADAHGDYYADDLAECGE